MSPFRIHPKMAEGYREKIGLLIDQLQTPGGMLDAKDALRGLIDRIVLVPDAETGRLAIHLEGALAALLMLSIGHDKTSRGTQDFQVTDITEELVLVAGVGFEPTTFRL
jgi:site-specific DNA recombinase